MVFGSEAIWWLNSFLLAALTHAGLLWMIATGETPQPHSPIETTITIETLATDGEVAAPPEPLVSENVSDIVRPEPIARAEIAPIANLDTKVAEKPIGKLENAAKPTDVVKRAEPSPADNVDVTSTGNDTAARLSAEPPTANNADIPETPTVVENEISADRPSSPQVSSGQVVRVDRIRSKPALNRNTVEPIDARQKPQASQAAKDNRGVERIAALSPSDQPAVPSAEFKSEKIDSKRSSENRVPENNENIVFPENAQRVSPVSPEPAAAAPAERVASVSADQTSKVQNPINVDRGANDLEQVAIARPKRAGRVEADSRYTELLDFLEDSALQGCAAVLPTVDNKGSVSLSGFAADETQWTQFQENISESLRIRLPLSAAKVARPQCRALTFARTLPLYPRFSLGMDLKKSDLTSGQALEGTITDVRDRKIHLVLVDDEGLVQQIDRFLQPKVSEMTFSVPISVRNQAVTTAQMAIALAVERPLSSVTAANATLADEFFQAVTEELASTRQKADIAIVSFYLRPAD